MHIHSIFSKLQKIQKTKKKNNEIDYYSSYYKSYDSKLVLGDYLLYLYILVVRKIIPSINKMNKSELLSPWYDEPRMWISRKLKKGIPWEDVATNPTGTSLEEFLALKEKDDEWPPIDPESWAELVKQQEEAEKAILELDSRNGQALVIDGTSNNSVFVPERLESCWQLYRNHLLQKRHFAESTVGEIERATLKILKRLSSDTRAIDPIKGLVIGNVQSGKTANMAALMAMAADWGWNMFIVLSGTIENLRRQTQERLYEDLNHEGCSRSWQCLEHLSPRSPIGSRAQHLHFDEGARERYFTVSLKNSKLLQKLIQWLQSDRNKMKQMRLLVIDDEADQAGINTAPVNSQERKKINKLICALVNGLDASSRAVNDKYLAMNYIGYTATPYANILNEASRESLYPRNFIATLSVSREYFGPQQIFGVPNSQYDGLDIVRTVPQEDLDTIKDIHKGTSLDMPDSMADAVCWFACCVAAMRQAGYTKPISMLIHTSQGVLHHERISNLVGAWVNRTDKNALVQRCKKIWELETARFSLDDFKEQYPDYGLKDAVPNYPCFNDILPSLNELFSVELKPIKLNEEGELKYHNGIHLCVDNSANNGTNDENEYLRLVYPDKNHMPEKAPAFLVIGGATLSRGLTLEGLVSTFFLRSVKQADTLMQMGRWFGYRPGYELYPRLWITDTARAQYDFLSILDQELREEIHMMEVTGLKPSEYAAKVRNSPRLQLIRITANNRMQGAKNAEMDYSGSFNQTYIFENDKAKLEGNMLLTRAFLDGLGNPEVKNPLNTHSLNSIIWKRVSIDTVEEFLKGFSFCDRMPIFNDISPLLSWVRQMHVEGKLEDWNVVLAGKKNAAPEDSVLFSRFFATKVSRTRKSTMPMDPKFINIGALRAPMDLIADVDLEGQPDDVKALFNHPDERMLKELRHRAGLGTTPQLLIYIVDKDSTPKPGSSRLPLAAPCDIVGICINIPGGAVGANYVAKVCVRLDNGFNDEGDLDGTNN